MPTAPPPPKKPLPPPTRQGNGSPPPAQPSATEDVSFGLSSGLVPHAHRTVIYGPGGIGKSTLASYAPGAIILDLEKGSLDIDVQRITPPDGTWTWDLLRTALHTDKLWEGCQTVVLDTGTAAEELCVANVIGTVKAGNEAADSIEAYGYGKGYVFVFENFIKLLSDLDQHVRAGRNVIVVCHDCITRALNPEGEDYPRWEPRLQSPPAGKSSIRHRLREWCDHLLFLNYDVAVTKSKDGKPKGVGSGTRTIYCSEMPYLMAKSRTLREPIPFIEGDSTLWDLIMQKETTK